MVIVRLIGESDAEAYAALRRDALEKAPLALSSSVETDFVSSAESVRQYLAGNDGSVIFGAFAPELVGSVGLMRPRHAKLRHKMTLWGVYVRPEARCKGAAAALMEAAIAHARSLGDVAWIQLSVGMPDARRLYERFGFETWGTEEDALRHDGVSVVEDHMALRL